MILLFNLNNYLGGGEKILLEYAKYLKHNNIEYLITSVKNSYIESYCKSNDLYFNEWPENLNDSLVYGVKSDLVSEYLNFLPKERNINILTFCFRDLYNWKIMVDLFNLERLKLSHIIYHPEDTKYLTSLEISKAKITKVNKKICNELYDYNAIMFPDIQALNQSIFNKTITKKHIEFYSLPIEIHIKNELENKLNKSKILILCISRFVNFKTAAIIGLLKTIKKNKNFTLNLIGYGRFKTIIQLYIRLLGISKRVNLLGKINHNELKRHIIKCDIGYAQGTSMLEIASYGKPVIISNYTTLLDIFKNYNYCLGYFGKTNNMEIGSRYYDKSNDFTTIDMAFNEIIENYDAVSKKTKEHILNFDSEKIFERMTKKIYSSKFRIELFGNLKHYKPSFYKKIIHRLYENITL